MSDEVKRELNIDIRRVLFRFSLPADKYQYFLKHIAAHAHSQQPDKEGVNPHWILHNHAKDSEGNFIAKLNNGSHVIEVLVRPTGQGEFRDFIKSLAHDVDLTFVDST